MDVQEIIRAIKDIERRLERAVNFEITSDGWTASPNTWTYASATTFTVAGDVTAKFPKGTKIKLTQTSVKYFYVTGASYSAPNTTVTITGGSDFSLANAAITSPYYSYDATPQGHPIWFNYTATINGSTGSLGTFAATVDLQRFALFGSMCRTRMQALITNKGSWTGNFQVARPVTKASETYSNFASVVVAQGAAANGAKGIQSSESASVFLFHKNVGSAFLTWTDIAVNDYVSIDSTYQI